MDIKKHELIIRYEVSERYDQSKTRATNTWLHSITFILLYCYLSLWCQTRYPRQTDFINQEIYTFNHFFKKKKKTSSITTLIAQIK